MIGSFRRTVEVWVESSVAADVYITTESWQSKSEAILDSKTISLLTKTPGIVGVDQLRKMKVSFQNSPIFLSGVNMSLFKQGSFPLLKGNREQIFNKVIGQNAVLISEPLSRKAALSVGDHLVVYGATGRVELPIAGIYYDYSSETGTAALDLSTMESNFGPGGINGISLYLDQNIDSEEMVEELKARFIDHPLRIRSNRQLREDIFKVFDQTFAVVRILQIISLLIAICGITLTLLILAREQIAELALYRALGANRKQIFRIFVGQGLAMGLMGLGLGLAGGILLALILIFVINRSYFGWTIQLHWATLSLAQQMTTILISALLASLYPALRASQTPAAELSHDDF
jgi:putative ABC transport system permease protein